MILLVQNCFMDVTHKMLSLILKNDLRHVFVIISGYLVMDDY
jgi:hypothetical protein